MAKKAARNSADTTWWSPYGVAHRNEPWPVSSASACSPSSAGSRALQGSGWTAWIGATAPLTPATPRVGHHRPWRNLC